jgi:hypothetical protein
MEKMIFFIPRKVCMALWTGFGAPPAAEGKETVDVAASRAKSKVSKKDTDPMLVLVVRSLMMTSGLVARACFLAWLFCATLWVAMHFEVAKVCPEPSCCPYTAQALLS